MGTSESLPDATVSVVNPAVRLFLYDYSGMLAKDKTLYFSHDADMRNDVKVRALRRRFGNTGYAAWNYLLEVLTDSPNFDMLLDDVNLELYADDFGIEKSELGEILNFMKSIRLLQYEGDRVWSDAHRARFAVEKERLTALSEARAAAGRKGMESRWGKKKITNDNTVIPAITNITEERREEESREEIKKEGDKKENFASDEAPSLPSLPCGKIADLWNSVCTAYPRCVKVTDRRKTKIRLRLAEMGCGSDEAETLKTLGDLFRRMQSSSFLRGDNGRGWQASFDWLFENGSNWVKVTEGNYDDRSGGGHRQTPPPQQQPGANVTCPIVPPRIGPGEYFDEMGRRTYGTGKATVPDEAPPRPSEQYFWNASTQQWLLL